MLRPGHQERFEPLYSRRQLVLLDGAGRVHVLGTNLGALSHERASPDSLMLGQHVHALMRALVTRVHVVALRERDRRWANEYRIETIYRTGGVTQQAIDAHAELLVAIELIRSLEVFAFGNRLFVSANEPGLDALQLAHKVSDFDHQVPDHGKIAQRLHPHRSSVPSVVRKEGGAGQFGLAVHHHPAASTNTHAAGPAKGE